MRLVFPPEWASIRARILESGAEFSSASNGWAPRWSRIPPTCRYGKTAEETALKSCIFRVHDCLHQLWGLPIPSPEMTTDDFYLLKRAQMCGEVAVLTLTEFVFCKWRYDHGSDATRQSVFSRLAIPLLQGPMRHCSTKQVAQRLDLMLHHMRRPKWIRDSPEATAFADDYQPMLERDREGITKNWANMRLYGWRPTVLPNARYNADLDGLELTQWMIDDFYHLMGTDPVVDTELQKFNFLRREQDPLPAWWDT